MEFTLRCFWNRTGNQRVEVTEAAVIFMDLSNNETGRYLKLLLICPNVPQRDWLHQLRMPQSILYHCILKFLIKSKLTIK